MKGRAPRKPNGELRQSQIVTTFGPGAMLDLPNHAVLVGGLELWRGDKERVHEERLEGWLREHLGLPELKLFAPPVDSDDPNAAPTGVTVMQFPAWFLGQVDETWREPDGRTYRTRPLVPYERLVNGRYHDRERKLRAVVPVRFVQACVRGHLSDIDWFAFVRGDAADRGGELWLDEGGSGNDFAEIFVRDGRDPHKRRPLLDASVPGSFVLGRCSGRKPWLGPRVFEKCDKPNRLLTRSASNAYFAQTMGVISLPDPGQALKDAVDRVWEDFLQYAEELRDVTKERRKEKVAAALEAHDDAAVWAEIERRRAGIAAAEVSIKDAEITTLLAQREAIGDDRPDGDFFARAHPIGPLPREAAGKVDRLVLVHRLREVVAQVGFTRFDPPLTDLDGELDLGVELAPLSREPGWLPAIQNRGEGLFVSFDPAAIRAWLARPGVHRRGQALHAGARAWAAEKKRSGPPPGLPYIMLHSLAHLLITTLALDCGYSASSIRERIYANDAGYGILLYTGTQGSEGTLGGLVDLGRDLGRHLTRALELGRLCSNDPVCAQHDPASELERRFLHGAACHGCLLIAETSCERRNDLLDRALVVPTVGVEDAAFFGPA